MQHLVDIKLWGDLGNKIGKQWKLAVSSVAESIRAIEMNSNHKLYQYLMETDKIGIKYRVLINGRDVICNEKPTLENPKPAFESELCVKFKNDSLKTIDIVPILEGADSGFFATFLGALLIIIGIVLILTGVGGILAPALIIGGLGLLAAGVTALLSKPPKFDDFREIDGLTGRTSYLFNGPQNTTREGGPVPIGYGRLLVGSQVISAAYVIKNIDAGNITVLNFEAGSLDANYKPYDTLDNTIVFYANTKGHPVVMDIGINTNLYTHLYGSIRFNTSFQISDYYVIKLLDNGIIQGFPNYAGNYGNSTVHSNDIGVIGDVYTLSCISVQNGDAVIIGGSFYIPGLIANNLLYINPDGTAMGNIDLRPNNIVYSSFTYPSNNASFANQVLIGGLFTSIVFNGLNYTYNGLARLGNNQTVMTIDTSFSNPNIQGGAVYCIAIDSNNNIYIGGNFTSVNGDSTYKGIAKLSSNGTLDTSFPAMQLKDINGNDAIVYSLAIHQNGVHADKIILGGNFVSVNGSTRNLIARVKNDGTLDSTVSFSTNIAPTNNTDSSSNSIVKTITIQLLDQKILVGGSFESVNNTRYNNIVRLNTDGSIDTSFKVQTETTSNSIKRVGTDQKVEKIIIRENDGKIFVGGQFIKYGDSDVKYIMRLNNGGYIS